MPRFRLTSGRASLTILATTLFLATLWWTSMQARQAHLQCVFLDALSNMDLRRADHALAEGAEVNGLCSCGERDSGPIAYNWRLLRREPDYALTTPLLAMVANSNVTAVRYLLAHGASLRLTTGDGINPLSIAEQNDRGAETKSDKRDAYRVLLMLRAVDGTN